MNGTSAGGIDIFDSAWIVSAYNINLVGSADGFFGGLQGWYECSDTTLHFETHQSVRLKHVRYWTRI